MEETLNNVTNIKKKKQKHQWLCQAFIHWPVLQISATQVSKQILKQQISITFRSNNFLNFAFSYFNPIKRKRRSNEKKQIRALPTILWLQFLHVLSAFNVTVDVFSQIAIFNEESKHYSHEMRLPTVTGALKQRLFLN